MKAKSSTHSPTPAIPVHYETCGVQHDNCPGPISGTCTQPVGHSGSHTCSGMRF